MKPRLGRGSAPVTRPSSCFEFPRCDLRAAMMIIKVALPLLLKLTRAMVACRKRKKCRSLGSWKLPRAARTCWNFGTLY